MSRRPLGIGSRCMCCGPIAPMLPHRIGDDLLAFLIATCEHTGRHDVAGLLCGFASAEAHDDGLAAFLQAMASNGRLLASIDIADAKELLSLIRRSVESFALPG